MSSDLKADLTVVESFAEYKDLAGKIYHENGRTEMYQTGWKDFDEYIGGGFGSPNRGELVVMIADTGVGKSTFMTNIALRIAPTTGQRIHYMSLENPPEDAYNTMCHIINKPTLGDMEKFFTAPKKAMIFGDKPWTADDLLAHMEYVVQAHGTKLFALDHLNFMFENETQVQNELARVRVVMRLLSQFCMNHQATVFVISHINKNQSKAGELLTLARVYGSGGIAGAATKVLALNESVGLGSSGSRFIDVQMLKSRYTNYDRKMLVRFDVSEYAWDLVGTLTRS